MGAPPGDSGSAMRMLMVSLLYSCVDMKLQGHLEGSKDRREKSKLMVNPLTL